MFPEHRERPVEERYVLRPAHEGGSRGPVHGVAVLQPQLAERLADSARKGDRVLVHGTTYDEEWTDREGRTRVKHVIQVSAAGVPLRYATATVHRAAKTNAQSQSEAEPVETSA